MKFLVTARDLYTSKDTRRVVQSLGLTVKKTGFRGVFLVEDKRNLAQRLNKLWEIGRAVEVKKVIESREQMVRKAAVETGLNEIKIDESFCFRVNKRGKHYLSKSTPDLEREIGEEIYRNLRLRDGISPKVKLKSPDIKIIGEVLGESTLICILRKQWLKGKL